MEFYLNWIQMEKKQIQNDKIEWPDKLGPAPPRPRRTLKVKVKYKGRSKPIPLAEPKG